MAPTRPACRPALETLRHYKAPSRPACRLALEPDAPDTRIYSLALCRGMLHLFATDTGRHKALPLFGHRDSHAQYCHNLFLWHAQWAILEMQTNHWRRWPGRGQASMCASTHKSTLYASFCAATHITQDAPGFSWHAGLRASTQWPAAQTVFSVLPGHITRARLFMTRRLARKHALTCCSNRLLCSTGSVSSEKALACSLAVHTHIQRSTSLWQT